MIKKSPFIVFVVTLMFTVNPMQANANETWFQQEENFLYIITAEESLQLDEEKAFQIVREAMNLIRSDHEYVFKLSTEEYLEVIVDLSLSHQKTSSARLICTKINKTNAGSPYNKKSYTFIYDPHTKALKNQDPYWWGKNITDFATLQDYF